MNIGNESINLYEFINLNAHVTSWCTEDEKKLETL